MVDFIPAAGLVVSDRYRLESLLGQGGMGSVWRAHHLTLNAPIAIKLIDPVLASSPDAQARFLREAQAAAALRSPHVVQTLDFGVDRGVPYIVMEMLVGESLADRLERFGRLSPADTARFIADIARAVGKAHAVGIVHRDLKPDNVFLSQDEDSELVKVLDFGIAKATGPLSDSSSRTRTGAILGTPYYMSPEQAQGDKRVDWRTDLWAMAVISFECLLGRRPFDADGLGSLIMQICAAPIPVPSQYGPVPAGFDAWWARATERDPAQRFQSARELTDALRAVLLAGESAARPGSDSELIPGDPAVVGMAHPHTPAGPTPAKEAGAAPAQTGGSEPSHLLGGSWAGTGSDPRVTGRSGVPATTTAAAVSTTASSSPRRRRFFVALLAAATLLTLGALGVAALFYVAPGAGSTAASGEPPGEPSALGDELGGADDPTAVAGSEALALPPAPAATPEAPTTPSAAPTTTGSTTATASTAGAWTPPRVVTARVVTTAATAPKATRPAARPTATVTQPVTTATTPPRPTAEVPPTPRDRLGF